MAMVVNSPAQSQWPRQTHLCSECFEEDLVIWWQLYVGGQRYASAAEAVQLGTRRSPLLWATRATPSQALSRLSSGSVRGRFSTFQGVLHVPTACPSWARSRTTLVQACERQPRSSATTLQTALSVLVSIGNWNGRTGCGKSTRDRPG